MNWTGGGLQRHSRNKGSQSKRQRAHFAKVRCKRHVPDPEPARHHLVQRPTPSRSQRKVASGSRDAQTARQLRAGDGKHWNQVQQSASRPLHSVPSGPHTTDSDHRNDHGRPLSKNEYGDTRSSLEEYRRRLLVTTDWIGLDNPRLTPVPKHKLRKISRNVYQAKPSRQAQRQMQQSLLPHSPVRTQDVNVLVGTQALQTSPPRNVTRHLSENINRYQSPRSTPCDEHIPPRRGGNDNECAEASEEARPRADVFSQDSPYTHKDALYNHEYLIEASPSGLVHAEKCVDHLMLPSMPCSSPLRKISERQSKLPLDTTHERYGQILPVRCDSSSTRAYGNLLAQRSSSIPLPSAHLLLPERDMLPSRETAANRCDERVPECDGVATIGPKYPIVSGRSHESAPRAPPNLVHFSVETSPTQQVDAEVLPQNLLTSPPIAHKNVGLADIQPGSLDEQRTGANYSPQLLFDEVAADHDAPNTAGRHNNMPHNDANDPHDTEKQHHHEHFSKASSCASEARPRLKRKRDLANTSPSWTLPKQWQQEVFEPLQPSNTGPRVPTGPKQPQKQPFSPAQLQDATPETARPLITDLKAPIKSSPSPTPLPASRNEAWKHFIFGSDPPEEDGDSLPAHNSAPSQTPLPSLLPGPLPGPAITHDHLYGKATAPSQDLDTLSLAPIVSSSSDGADVEVGTRKTHREACLGRGGDGLSIRVQVDRHREREWSSIWGAGRYCADEDENNDVENGGDSEERPMGSWTETSETSRGGGGAESGLRKSERRGGRVGSGSEDSRQDVSVERVKAKGSGEGTTRWWRNGRRVDGRSRDRDRRGRQVVEISSEEADESEEEEEEDESEADEDSRG